LLKKNSLWSFSARRLQLEQQEGRSLFSPRDILDLVKQGLITVQARDQWFEKSERNRYDDATLHWDDEGIDDEIRRIANAGSSTAPVVRAGEQGRGQRWATEQFEARTAAFHLAHQLVLENRIPQNVQVHINRLQLDRDDDKARLILQVFRNHDDARVASSTISCEEEGFPITEYSTIVDRDATAWKGP